MSDTSTTEPWRSTEPEIADRKYVRQALRLATNGEILDEVESRGLEDEVIGDGKDDIYDYVIVTNRETVLEALIAIKNGRVKDGVVILEREFFPRYADEAECRRRYEQEMGLAKGRVQ